MSMTTPISTPTNSYETDKLNLAAYLIASGAVDLVRAYCPGSGSIVMFVLSRTPTENQISSFFNGTGMVSARKYADTLANLKAAVFEAKRSSRGCL